MGEVRWANSPTYGRLHALVPDTPDVPLSRPFKEGAARDGACAGLPAAVHRESATGVIDDQARQQG